MESCSETETYYESEDCNLLHKKKRLNYIVQIKFKINFGRNDNLIKFCEKKHFIIVECSKDMATLIPNF